MLCCRSSAFSTAGAASSSSSSCWLSMYRKFEWGKISMLTLCEIQWVSFMCFHTYFLLTTVTKAHRVTSQTNKQNRTEPHRTLIYCRVLFYIILFEVYFFQFLLFFFLLFCSSCWSSVLFLLWFLCKNFMFLLFHLTHLYKSKEWKEKFVKRK